VSSSSSSPKDLIDTMVGLSPGDPVHTVRHGRDKVAAATQASHEALFDPNLPGLSLTERLLAALLVCRLTPSAPLADHYAGRLAELGTDPALVATVREGDPAGLADSLLRAILAFTRTLVLEPIKGDEAALKQLPAAGLSTPAVVTLAQLIAYLSYQTRVVAGLAAMRAAPRT